MPKPSDDAPNLLRFQNGHDKKNTAIRRVCKLQMGMYNIEYKARLDPGSPAQQDALTTEPHVPPLLDI